MRNELGNAFTRSVQRAIVGAVEGLESVAEATVETVRDALTTGLKSVGGVGDEVGDLLEAIASGVLEGGREAGGSPAEIARGLVLGVLRGAHESGRADLESTLAFTTRTAVRLVGPEDAGHAARGALEGAVEGARELGADPLRYASVAWRSATEAARELGDDAVERVAKAVHEVMTGHPAVARPTTPPQR